MNPTPSVETLCKWGKVKEVHTVRGPRMLRTAAATEDFWPVWNEHSASLKLLGLQVKRRMDDPNKWQVCWWQQLPADVLAQREKLVEMSEATSAAVDIPKPEGLDYYPFQKAGVRYCLNAFAANGVLIGDEMGLGKTVQAIGVINATCEDICGLCGGPGADKLAHPIHWPGEQVPDGPMVHSECEDAECRRAHALLTPEQRDRFLKQI